jgi:hypothetical protein
MHTTMTKRTVCSTADGPVETLRIDAARSFTFSNHAATIRFLNMRLRYRRANQSLASG